jgi:hypothetical protein
MQTLLADVVAGAGDRVTRELQLGVPAGIGADHVEAVTIAHGAEHLGGHPSAMRDAVLAAP